MTSQEFDRVPAFPSDVPTIQLPRISLAKMLADDAKESAKFFEAAKDLGFMMLDLSDCPEGKQILQDVDMAFDVNREIMAIDDEEKKKKWPYRTGSLGYKHRGMLGGLQDRSEMFSVSLDDLLSPPSQALLPPVCDDKRTRLITSYDRFHETAAKLFEHLEKHLELAPNTLKSLHARNAPSNTHFRYLRYLAPMSDVRTTSLMGHTDNGTITILFNIIGGLQVLPPGKNKDIDSDWRYVKPQPGCAVVNLGDSLVQYTGGLLRSNMHRVRDAPGDQSKVDRYSFCFVLKPGVDAPMNRLKSSVIPPLADGEEDVNLTYGEFHLKKIDGAKKGINDAKTRREELAVEQPAGFQIASSQTGEAS